MLILLSALAVFAGCGGGGTGLTEVPEDSPFEDSPGGEEGESENPGEVDERIPSDAPRLPEGVEITAETEQVPVYSPVSPLGGSTGDGVTLSEPRRFRTGSRTTSSVDTGNRAALRQSVNSTADFLAGAYGLRGGSGNEYNFWSDKTYYGWPRVFGGADNDGSVAGALGRGLLAALHFDTEANTGPGMSPANVAQDLYTSGPGPITTGKNGYLGEAFEHQDDNNFQLVCPDISYQMEYANLAQDPSEVTEAQAAFQRLIDAMKDPNGSNVVGGGPFHHGSSPDNSRANSARNLVDFFIHRTGRAGAWNAAMCAVAAERTGNTGYAKHILDHLLASEQELDSEGPGSGWRAHSTNARAEDMAMGALLVAFSETDFRAYKDPANDYARYLVFDAQSRSYGYFGDTVDGDGEFEEGEFLLDHTQQHAWITLGLSKYLTARQESGIDGGDPGSVTALMNIAVDKAQEWLFRFVIADNSSYPSYVIGATSGDPAPTNLQVNGTVLRTQATVAENRREFSD